MMHEFYWHDNWWPYFHMAGMWFWPAASIIIITIVAYLLIRNSITKKRR